MKTKVTFLNKPLVYIIIVLLTLTPLLGSVGGYFIFYFAWKYLSPIIILSLTFIIGLPSLYFIATMGQYFTFIHSDDHFTFKKILLSRKVRVGDIRKLEIYYPGPTTPEEFNKEDTELKWWGKRNPSAVRLIFYLKNREIFKVGMTYIPIAEYIRKHLLSQGVTCVERYVASLQPESYIDVVYRPGRGEKKVRKKKNIEDYLKSGEVPPPPWLGEN